jgi:hypothetical protein
MSFHIKSETKGLDNFLRIFPKVMRDKNLTMLKKYLLCDIISMQMQGKQHYKTSARIAEDLGSYKQGTIDTAFQELEKQGYINTFPYNDGKHKDSLRESKVVQMEQWIYTNEHLEKIQFKALPLRKREGNNPNWKTKNSKKSSIHISVIEEKINDSNVEDISSEEKQLILNAPAPLFQMIEDEGKGKEDHVENTEAIQSNITDVELDINQYLTPRKLDFLKRFEKNGTALDDFLKLDKPALDTIFYPNNVWNIKTMDDDQEVLIENINGINLHYHAGDRMRLFINGRSNKRDSFQLSTIDYDRYLKERSIDFGILNLDDFKRLRKFEKQPLKVGY